MTTVSETRVPFQAGPRFRGFLLAGALVMAMGLWRTQFMVCWVWGDSMWPTLNNGDLLLVDLRAYVDRPPSRGDVVVVRWQQELWVKRVVGLPGEIVEVRQGTLYVNEQPVLEDHPVFRGNLTLGKGRIYPGRYALLGDNRHVSDLIPVHAVVPQEQLVGKVVARFRLWPATAPAHESSEAPTYARAS